MYLPMRGDVMIVRASQRPVLLALLTAVLLSFQSRSDAISVSAIIQQSERARSDLLAHWRYDPLLVCQAAGVHGPIEKRAAISAFMNLYVRNQTVVDAFKAAGVPIYGGIQVFISHRFRFVYVRQPKASSTSILVSIQRQFCMDKVCESHEFARVDDLTTLDDATWRDYFVFTAVRNPMARMLSTFNMIKAQLRIRDHPGAIVPGKPCSLSFDAYARNVGVLRDVCETQKCCTWRYSEGALRFVPDFPNQHITLQAHSFLTPEGDSAVDYIARTEFIDDDWQEIVSLIETHSGRQTNQQLSFEKRNVHQAGSKLLVSLPPGAQPPCLAPDVAAQGYLNESTVLSIAQQFALDLVVLRFLPTPSVADGSVLKSR